MSDCDIRESAVRVLVVDDFELWRRHLVRQLTSRTDLLVVGEASDGPGALRKVEELAPALILLDVGLPGMDGIAVASAIVRASPKSNILIMSAHNSGAIVRAAFRAGARGYLSKSAAGRELIPAINAMVRGDLFVSGGIASDNAPGEHAVQFYADDGSLVASCCDLVVGALRNQHPVIVVATKIHRDRLNEQLAARGVEISSYIDRGYHIVRDAAETLSHLMTNHLPDPADFLRRWAACSGRPRP
jgi:DNA-binding NarL/FixJ family response regulator